MFKRIAIVGLGLIGGSIGLALHHANGIREIVGYDKSEGIRQRALEVGAIDRLGDSLAETVQGAELVVLATPVGAMQYLLKEIGLLVSPETVITDVASTKAQVVAWAEEYLPASVPFIGGHPMTGKEVSGVEVADPALFEDCIYCLTPTASTHLPALRMVASLVELLHAHIRYLAPEEHDKQVAGVSHLPFIASVALVDTVTKDATWSDASLLAASGFRDMSRLAAGNPEMYRDICMTNSNAVVSWLDRYISSLQTIRDTISVQDEGLGDMFAEVQRKRLHWSASRDSSKMKNNRQNVLDN